MSIKTPRLTRDRCGVFYIRLVVPKALRADIGKSELRRSLRTNDCSIAKHRVLIRFSTTASSKASENLVCALQW